MAVPDFQSLMLPMLKLAADNQPHTLADAMERLALEFRLTDADRNELLKSGQTRLYNRTAWCATYLRKAGLLEGIGPGRFQITQRGRDLLAENPRYLDIGFLTSRYPAMQEFRNSQLKAQRAADEPPAVFNAVDSTWTERPGVATRIRETLEASLPEETTRVDALRFLASVIGLADQERSDAWYVRETTRGLRLMAGRLYACALRGNEIRVSIVGPIGDDVRATLSATSEEEFKSIPDAVLLGFPAARAADATRLLRENVARFMEGAMARVRRSVSLDEHAPEAVNYIASVIAQPVPQPEPSSASPDSGTDEQEADDADELASREPRVRGRAPIFEIGNRSIASLVSDIEQEVIALPDLQRPFVWEDTKVRDLLDSLFVGFPVGTLVLWHTSGDAAARAVGSERPGLRATTLVIDGQQRLTSLYAVMQGADIVGKDGETRKVSIAFRPRDGRFEVADAAIRRDPEFLPNVTELWTGSRQKSQIRRDLLNALRDRGRIVDASYEDAVERNLERAHGIGDYRFPTVDIRRTAARGEEATDEDVADIFVRINNQGTRLGQADFVLTLLSVFHRELRDQIEEKSRAMSAGAIVTLDPQQLLRAACAVAFGRARMSAVYRYLRGVDPTTGEANTAARSQRLGQLDAAAQECMQATPWRDYLLRVTHAGFVNQTLVASKNAIVNGFAFYTRGRRQGVPKSSLDEALSRWVFGSLLTARYSGSSETKFETDLARVGADDPHDPNAFVRTLDGRLADTITGDYWTQSLVSALETQKARAPAALAFRAAQVVLGARALFSDQLLQNVLDPPAQGGRTAGEVHHLFPEAWLRAHGIRERRHINQVANLADVGWYENALIGGKGPADYVPRVRDKLGIGDERWGRMCAEHALPPKWDAMSYGEFLQERRTRMAEIIRIGYRQLGGEAGTSPLTPPWFLPGAEMVWKGIAEIELGLRDVVRKVFVARFGDQAASAIEGRLPEREREALSRALRSRPLGAEPLSIVDYLYLGQIPPLLLASDVWQEARSYFGGAADAKQRLQAAISTLMPVRNEIAHVREVEPQRLQKASVACADLAELLRTTKSLK